MKRLRTPAVFLALGAVLVPLGLAVRAAYSPVRFTGFLLVCAGLASALWAGLALWSRRSAWGRWAKRAFLLLLAAGTVLFAALEVWVVSWAKTDSQTPVGAVVVLGAGVNGATPSLSLTTRLEAALDYLAGRPDIPVVVTGARGPGEDITEARCMADWLIAHGVDPGRILLEEQARDTAENMAFSREMLAQAGVDPDAKVALVTSDYHLCRAAGLWGRESAVPVAARMPGRFWPLTVNYYIREAFALAAELVF